MSSVILKEPLGRGLLAFLVNLVPLVVKRFFLEEKVKIPLTGLPLGVYKQHVN